MAKLFCLDDLKSRLDIHVSNMEKIRVIRLEKNEGLMTARQAGINAARADVIVIMDAHMEVAEGKSRSDVGQAGSDRRRKWWRHNHYGCTHGGG